MMIPLRPLLALALGMILLGGCARTTEPLPGRFDRSYADWNHLLTTHLRADGLDYAAVAADRTGLERAVMNLERVGADEFAGWPPAERLAYLINAHNIMAVRQIVERWPARRSVVRNAREVELLGRHWSLRELAEAAMSRDYNEPRAIFLLNWGERGCAPLPEVAAMGQNLPTLLDRQTRRVINDERYARFDWTRRRAELTPLLSEYRENFERIYGSLWVFLERNLAAAEARNLADRRPKLDFMPFDRTLAAGGR